MYIYIYIYICNTLPLDNSKIHLHTALPYITWGLIQDLKIKKEIPIEIKILSVIPKNKKDESFVLRRFKNLSYEVPVKDFGKIASKSAYRDLRLHERRNNFAINHQINIKFKCWGCVGICEIE